MTAPAGKDEGNENGTTEASLNALEQELRKLIRANPRVENGAGRTAIRRVNSLHFAG
jgi:hypothetical protein